MKCSMKQKEVFSGPALGLSVLTAALADAAAPAGSVRTALLSGLLNAAVLSALILLAGAFWQRSQAFRLAWMTALPLWLLAELARTVLQAHAVCREEFRSMALLGALPLLLWAGGQLAPGSWNAAAQVLWWMVFLGLVLCLPGLLGQMHWARLVAADAARPARSVQALVYAEYFFGPPQCAGKTPKHLLGLPWLAFAVQAAAWLGMGLVFGAGDYPQRELPTAQPVPMLRMADVELTSVDWLWFPYIPFGKLTIIQGNPGEGKTYFAMRLAAACTNRKPLPGMETLEPFNIIYQTAEDGLGDTVKPRLMEAEADLERVLVIDDRDTPLTLADERIARAIRENNTRLVIIDPVQAFLGADVDMNRANEVRPIFRSLGDIAQATGCAIVLIGHLNKAAGTQSTYRGLGSIDITAAVRSLLFIGKLKDSPTTRVLIHEKSSLAPPGQSLAFSLGDEKGFEWIGAYDITADEPLAGTDTAKTESKTAQAQMLILELLADGKRMPSAELEKAVNERGISSRTMRTAKSRIGDRLVTEKDGTAWVCYLRD